MRACGEVRMEPEEKGSRWEGRGGRRARIDARSVLLVSRKKTRRL